MDGLVRKQIIDLEEEINNCFPVDNYLRKGIILFDDFLISRSLF